MLDSIGEFIVDKFYNPCKKCLVKAACRPHLIKCDNYKQYLDTRNEAGRLVEFWGMLAFVGIELIFMIIIFISFL